VGAIRTRVDTNIKKIIAKVLEEIVSSLQYRKRMKLLQLEMQKIDVSPHHWNVVRVWAI
jgi:hypothetical protein